MIEDWSVFFYRKGAKTLSTAKVLFNNLTGVAGKEKILRGTSRLSASAVNDYARNLNINVYWTNE